MYIPEKFKIFIQDFVPIRTALITTYFSYDVFLDEVPCTQTRFCTHALTSRVELPIPIPLKTKNLTYILILI